MRRDGLRAVHRGSARIEESSFDYKEAVRLRCREASLGLATYTKKMQKHETMRQGVSCRTRWDGGCCHSIPEQQLTGAQAAGSAGKQRRAKQARPAKLQYFVSHQKQFVQQHTTFSHSIPAARSTPQSISGTHIVFAAPFYMRRRFRRAPSAPRALPVAQTSQPPFTS